MICTQFRNVLSPSCMRFCSVTRIKHQARGVSSLPFQKNNHGTPDSDTPEYKDLRWQQVANNLTDWRHQPPLSKAQIEAGQKWFRIEKQLERLASEVSKTNQDVIMKIEQLMEKINNK